MAIALASHIFCQLVVSGTSTAPFKLIEPYWLTYALSEKIGGREFYEAPLPTSWLFQSTMYGFDYAQTKIIFPTKVKLAAVGLTNPTSINSPISLYSIPL